MRYAIRVSTRALVGVACALALTATVASAAVTPGWECIPTTAGQSVVSGGTAATPSCSAGTPVLAPTYVSSGVGGKPTVEFASVNVQIVSGSGSTSGTVNGEGNLVVGYAENANSHAQTGSNDLILGTNNGWSGYGELVGGTNDIASGAYATSFGQGDTASGASSFVTGQLNAAKGGQSAVSGGTRNTASGVGSSVSGGQYNLANDTYATATGGCDNVAGSGSVPQGSCGSGLESTLGGLQNSVSGLAGTASGGSSNAVNAEYGSAAGGLGNAVDAKFASAAGGYSNLVDDSWSFIGGGCGDATGAAALDISCPSGGEGISGGQEISGSSAEGTYGAISDGANVGQSGSYKISFTLASKACALLAYGVPAAVKGDLAIVSYETNPPSGLTLSTTGVTTTGKVEVNACNESSATVTYDNVPIRVETFR